MRSGDVVEAVGAQVDAVGGRVGAAAGPLGGLALAVALALAGAGGVGPVIARAPRVLARGCCLRRLDAAARAKFQGSLE
jgi:hypothetical protein